MINSTKSTSILDDPEVMRVCNMMYNDGFKHGKKEATEKFLSLLDKAIEEWNEPHRHQSYVIDKEGALRRFKKAIEE